MASKRMFILDTNVLVYDPESILTFKGALVGIPITVLEELDKFKNERSDRGHNAREVNRRLDALRKIGSLREGVSLENGELLKILFVPANNRIEIPFADHMGDNSILLIALYYKNEGYDVVFISKDINARVKADALGLQAQDYLKGHITRDRFYKGWTQVFVPAVSLKREFPPELEEELEKGLLLNQFVQLTSQSNPFNFKIFRYIGGKEFLAVNQPDIKWPMKARNPEQIMALDLLFDPNIQFVTLFGQAGTGKTFLALLAGLHQVLVEDKYKKMLVSRPVVPLGQDVGYLPGTLEEKLHSWMMPIYDNMEFIVHEASIQARPHWDDQQQQSQKNYKKGKKHKDRAVHSLEDLVRQEKISLEAITYMRGRSIPYQFILIDEVQNLTPHEVKTLITPCWQSFHTK